MPKIGFRIIKTAFAAFICFLLHLVFLFVFSNRVAQLYSPFFASLAAVYSISNEHRYSFKLARVRSVGSIIGSIVAVALVILFEISLQPLLMLNGIILTLFVKYVLVTIFLVILIYLTIIFKQTDATFVSLLTFLSISVGNLTNLSPAAFAFNRTISTIIGVLIALAVNFVTFNRHRNKNILFVVGVDNIISNNAEPISSQKRFILNDLIYSECNLIISTIHTPTTLEKIFPEIKFDNPHIVMNGAAIYDQKNNSFSNVVYINNDIRFKIEDVFEQYSLNYFTHIILHDTLTIYYEKLENEGEITYFENRRTAKFKSYAKGVAPKDEKVVYFLAIDTKTKVLQIIENLKELGLEKELDIITYQSKDVSGYYQLRIRNKKATKFQAIKKMSDKNNSQKIIALGQNEFDIPMLKSADYSICCDYASDSVQKACSHVLENTCDFELLKIVRKLYFHRYPLKYLEKLKTKNKH